MLGVFEGLVISIGMVFELRAVQSSTMLGTIGEAHLSAWLGSVCSCAGVCASG
jgi:hypothetical protein